MNRIFNQFSNIMAKCGNIPGVKTRIIRMKNYQIVELKKERSDFHLKKTA